MKKVSFSFILALLWTAYSFGVVKDSPKIVHITNFCRLIEPRNPAHTTQVLFDTTRHQAEMMQKYNLGGTFLLQYDALLDERYQKLMKSLPSDSFETGAWWEIPQPLAERSGIKWRGRYAWDWHADVGFSTGYTPEERERLVDTYMHDFYEIFGTYPKSMGSWFIDAHTLDYAHRKYGVIASANCKDQVGTDGYTLWGGYWNQAYYPSKVNAYMPAQHKENQIDVPIFRMLGSDPVFQYDYGIGRKHISGMQTLEPVYMPTGGNEKWCRWFFDTLAEDPALNFGYTQTGQENSFVWRREKVGVGIGHTETGYKIQMPMIAALRDQGKVKVETLAQSAQWFKEKYQVTPPTSVTALSDPYGEGCQTVWFNSRFYRMNLFWDNGKMRFRDIHLFDETVESEYFRSRTQSSQCSFYTLPVMDGFLWSSGENIAGIRFMTDVNGKLVELEGGIPSVDNSQENRLCVTWGLASNQGEIEMVFAESSATIQLKNSDLKNLVLDLSQGNATQYDGEAKDRSPSKSLRITSAIYRAVDGIGEMDVTTKLAEMANNGSLAIRVGNAELGGDPARGRHKQLVVVYSYGDKVFNVTVNETKLLEIPDVADAASKKVTIDGLPLMNVASDHIDYKFKGNAYYLVAETGTFEEKPDHDGWWLQSEAGKIELRF